MGVPPNHQFLIIFNGIFLYKPSIFGYLHVWKPPNRSGKVYLVLVPVSLALPLLPTKRCDLSHDKIGIPDPHKNERTGISQMDPNALFAWHT